MGPQKTLQEWFKKLPKEVQEGVAYSAVTCGGEEFFPAVDEEGEGAAAETVRQFEVVLGRKPGSPMAEVGKVIVIGGLVDFIFLKRSTKEDWDEAATSMQGAAEHAKKTGRNDMLKSAEKFAAQLPLRAGMWIREGTRWKKLRAGALSLRAMDQWMMESLIVRTSKR